jgi:hypothetical protein
MTMKKLHFISGLIMAVFIALHLFNHACSIFGADTHIEVMSMLRPLYRNLFVESVLLLAVLVQIVSGLGLLKHFRKTASSSFDKLHIWSGLYLAIFLIIHVGAVLSGRFFLHLDTNFYFGVAGLNTFPLNLFFVPYYVLAILSFFWHVASIHSRKMKAYVLSFDPKAQAKAILVIGLVVTVLIFWGLTNGFKGVTIPGEFKPIFDDTVK